MNKNVKRQRRGINHTPPTSSLQSPQLALTVCSLLPSFLGDKYFLFSIFLSLVVLIKTFRSSIFQLSNISLSYRVNDRGGSQTPYPKLKE